MKIAFFGTGEFSRNILKGILEHSEIEIGLVVSQIDKPVGRKKEIIPTQVKLLAQEKNIKVLQPEKLKNNTELFSELKEGNFDFIIVVAYGKIIPKEILEIPKYGCINIHGSILPKYRGASPIQESIKNGDVETGLTIMYMSEGMDTGDILEIEKINIDIVDNTLDIFNKFEKIGPDLLINTLKKVIKNTIAPIKQEEAEASYCSKINKSDGEIDWKKQTAKEIYDKFRAYTPWPGIYSFYEGKKISIEDCFYYQIDLSDDDELKTGDVIEIENEHDSKNKEIGVICKHGILILKKIKLEGKKTMDINTFINGNKKFLEYNFIKIG